jgi:folate-binding protein YgfZ
LNELALHEIHQQLGARFTEVSGTQVVARYGDAPAEYQALTETAALLDFSFRGRLCLTGADRVRFLHGQVTNDIKALRPGFGCYAAVVNAKGRMEADLNVYSLEQELLLDFEPGLSGSLTQRLDKYIVADDVQVVDVATLYGLLTVQGPRAEAVIRKLTLFEQVPAEPFHILKQLDSQAGEVYLANQPRLRTKGFDLFVPVAALALVAERLIDAVRSEGGGPTGWEAFEMARIEAGIPRFGVDMDGTNFPQECGIETRALSYSKGCYIGQEVLNRIHTLGHVNRSLVGLRLVGEATDRLSKGDKLFRAGKEVGYLTSSAGSPKLGALVALGYVRNDAQAAGTELILRTASGELGATVIRLSI